MSGHSKWSQIKHRKAITDKKKSQVFSKLSRLITLAAKKGADLKFNVALTQIVERARKENMPNENIERAIKKVKDGSLEQLEELFIEAIGPGGVALKIKAITDNRNRTIAEIKKILADNNAKMVLPDSIGWMFNQPPVQIMDPIHQGQLEKLLETLDDQDDVEDIVDNLE